MKVDLSQIDYEYFNVKTEEVAGDPCHLIIPQHIGCKWNKGNLIFRSSIWNEDGQPVSLSFKKFFNWGEQPDLAYTPFSFTANGGCQLIEKIDGSTLIVSEYKGELIARTRGTFDASRLDNGHEIDFLKEKYPLAFKPMGHYSYIYEWVSPENRIVIDYGADPDIYLIGIIDHILYTMESQDFVDQIAKDIGVKRPQRFDFGSIKEMLAAIEELEGQEGLCCYCNKGQDIRKVKSAWYLALHRFKENANMESTLDLYFELDQPGYQGFEAAIIQKFDYECYNLVRGFASQICDAEKEVSRIIVGMVDFVERVRELETRKEQALKIIESYGKTNRASYVFNLLDGKEIGREGLKKLFYQVMK